MSRPRRRRRETFAAARLIIGQGIEMRSKLISRPARYNEISRDRHDRLVHAGIGVGFENGVDTPFLQL